MEEPKYNVKAYVPTVLLTTDVLTSSMFLTTNDILKRSAIKLEDAYSTIRKEYSKYRSKVIHKFAPNNWLKMHGYPMRRRKARK